MNETKIGYFNLLITVVLFSTFEAVSKTLVGKMDPFQINFYRFLLGGALLFIFLAFKGDISISKRDFVWVTFLGFINVAISMNLLQMSLNVPGAKASIVAVIFSSNPIFIYAFSAVVDKEPLHLRKVIGFLVGITGIIVIFLQKLDIQSLDYRSPLMALISAVFYGLFTFYGRKVSLRIGSLKMNSYSFLLGSMILIPLLLFMKVPVWGFAASAWVQIGYLAVFVTGIAYLTYFRGLSIVGASSGSLVFFLKPALASVIAIVFLKEQITLNLLIGTALIIAGIVVVVRNKAAAQVLQNKPAAR